MSAERDRRGQKARSRARRGRRVAGLFFILTLITAACSQNAPSDEGRSSTGDLPASDPPLRLATLEATADCPTTRGRGFNRPSAPFGGMALGLGGRVQAIVAVPQPGRVKQGIVELKGLQRHDRL